MTHVLVRNNLVVKTIHPTRALKSTESANGGTRREVNDGVVIYVGGTVTLTGGKVSDISNPNSLSTAEERRERVKRWLREAELLPVANWGLGDSDKAENYWWWLEIIGRASKTNSNLTNATRWAALEAEIEHNPVEWYREHTSGWDSIRDADTWYSTNNSWAPANAPTSMVMTATWTGGLVEYLHG